MLWVKGLRIFVLEGQAQSFSIIFTSIEQLRPRRIFHIFSEVPSNPVISSLSQNFGIVI